MIIVESTIFTTLLPTRIVFKSFSFLSKRRLARIAFLSPLFFKSRNRSLLIEKNALSEAEKVAESKIRTTAIISSPIIFGVNIVDCPSVSMQIPFTQRFYFRHLPVQRCRKILHSLLQMKLGIAAYIR